MFFQKISRRENKSSDKNQMWLLSPQRLISGMSFVGQWENRLIAILKTAQKHNHLLYFDDLPGLFFAGVSANSDLNVAQVLKPYIETPRRSHCRRNYAGNLSRFEGKRQKFCRTFFTFFRLEETASDENSENRAFGQARSRT